MGKHYIQILRITDRLVSYLRTRDSQPRPGEDEMWGKIEQEINRKRKYFVKRTFYTIAAAAAITLLLLLPTIYSQIGNEDSLDNYVALLDDLVLDESKIQIHLSSVETVTVEDNNASIVYSSKGNVSINETERPDTLPGKKMDMEFNQIVVPKGKYTLLTLSDGSTVHVNSGTRVVYPRVFASDRREIYVEGEACLHVTKNKQVPFIVKTASFEVEVLGTTFNVNAYKKNPSGEVVLVEGSVKLSGKDNKQIVLKPDQLALVNEGRVDAVETVDARNYIAWTDGLLAFHLDSLKNIFKKMEHFYGVSIQVSAEAGSLRMKGKIDLKQSIDDMLALIATTAPVSYEKRDGVYYVSKK